MVGKEEHVGGLADAAEVCFGSLSDIVQSPN
jgi:hypothetical protein